MTVLVVAALLWELFWYRARRRRRAAAYALALRESRSLGLPLVVVGAPDAGVTGGYGCGDLTVDLSPSACPAFLRADAAALPLPDDSAVVLVSCVLEYAADPEAVAREILRVSGGRVYVVGVEPWTLAAWLYPGTRRPGAASLLSRRVRAGGIDLASTPWAWPRGQGLDLVADLDDGRRWHLSAFPDGSWSAHVDRHSPRGPAAALGHLVADVAPAVLSPPPPRWPSADSALRLGVRAGAP